MKQRGSSDEPLEMWSWDEGHEEFWVKLFLDQLYWAVAEKYFKGGGAGHVQGLRDFLENGPPPHWQDCAQEIGAEIRRRVKEILDEEQATE